MITGTALEHEGGTFAPQFAFTADDKSFKLGLTKHIRTFETMKMSDVISQLTSSYGLSLDMTSAERPGPGLPAPERHRPRPARHDHQAAELRVVGRGVDAERAAGRRHEPDGGLDPRSAHRPDGVLGPGERLAARLDQGQRLGSQGEAGHPGHPPPVSASAARSRRSPTATAARSAARWSARTTSSPATRPRPRRPRPNWLPDRCSTMWQGDAVAARGLSLINAKVTPERDRRRSPVAGRPTASTS